MSRVVKAIIVWSALVLSACVPIAPPAQPKPPVPVVINDPTFPQQCADIWQQELGRPIDPEGLAGCLAQFQSSHGDTVRAAVHDSAEGVAHRAAVEAAIEAAKRMPFPPEHGFLTRDGKVFRTDDGAVWSWRGETTFMLFARMLRGEDITPLLIEARKNGVNGLRVFGRVSADKGWPDFADYQRPETDPAFAAKLGAFFDLCATNGLRVEYVPLTYADDTAVQRAQLQQAYDVAAGRWNVFIEDANEPGPQGIDVLAAMQGVDRHGVLSAYGLYDLACDGVHVCTVPMLDYFTFHGDRGNEWPRKMKDALELRDGFGDGSNPMQWFGGTGRPTIGDEPIGANEVTIDGKRSAVATDFAQAFATCAVFSSGCTFHSESGLRSEPLGPVQRTIAAAVLDIWKLIPPAAQTGRYTRGGLDDLPTAWAGESDSLRDYGVILGNEAWVVSVRPSPGHVLTGINGWRVDASAANGTVVHLVR